MCTSRMLLSLRENIYCIVVILSLSLLSAEIFAELPSDLPGQEVSQDYLNWSGSKDTSKPADSIITSSGLPGWLAKAMKTWDAPPFSEQQASDKTNIPMGKGGIFIPCITSKHSEPDVEIIDPNGKSEITGKPGQVYAVQPGKYYVMFGSGAHRQRIVREVEVEEDQTTPIVPDWAALSIEVVDEMTNPFRGDYELARIDEFEPFGRGYGANPDLGEEVKTWILKPGLYKIFGSGQGFNTLTNFVTVRLLPGELIHFLLIEEPKNSNRIIGGGNVGNTGSKLSSNWKYNASIGGSVSFDADLDHNQKQTNIYRSNLTLLALTSVNFYHNPFSWENKLRLNEGLTVDSFNLSNVSPASDEIKLSSQFIWHFFPWFGPYGRAEIKSNFFSKSNFLPLLKKYFCVLDTNYYIDPSSSFDTSALSFVTNQSFSPLTLDIGGGANADLLNLAFFESKLRVGLGGSYNHWPSRYELVDSSKVKFTTPADSQTLLNVQNSVILHRLAPASTFELGPQIALNVLFRIARFAIVNSELTVFAPVAPEERFTRPDFDLAVSLSYQLTRALTLDYNYAYVKKQPLSKTLQQDKTTHGVLLRLNYSSR